MIPHHEMLLRLFVAAVLGCLVGLERERLDRAAGLRTHALLGLGAALCMPVSSFGFADILRVQHVGLDPSRVAAQVVSGIGFLGASTIILRRDAVRGLTTAASLWAVAGVGLACGDGLYVAASGATLLVDSQQVTTAELREAVESANLTVARMVIHRDESAEADRIELTLRRSPPEALLTAADNLRQLSGVKEINLETPPPARVITRG